MKTISFVWDENKEEENLKTILLLELFLLERQIKKNRNNMGVSYYEK